VGGVVEKQNSIYIENGGSYQMTFGFGLKNMEKEIHSKAQACLDIPGEKHSCPQSTLF